MHISKRYRSAKAFLEFRLNRSVVFINVEGRSEYKESHHDHNYENSYTNCKPTHDFPPSDKHTSGLSVSMKIRPDRLAM